MYALLKNETIILYEAQINGGYIGKTLQNIQHKVNPSKLVHNNVSILAHRL